MINNLLNRNWCSNCQSSECDCVSDDNEDLDLYDIDYSYEDEEPVSEKELWEAENKILDK
jgi:hypothetical protein